jgi:hypothetical protein
MTQFKVFCQHSCGDTNENHKDPSMSTDGAWVEN